MNRGRCLQLTGPLVLLALVGIFFREAILTDELTLPWDAADYSYPIQAYISHWYRQGVIPLWIPGLFNGYPLFADPGAQMFYPISLLFTALTTLTPWVVYLQLTLHYYLAGLFMYWLCLRLGYRWCASLIAAVGYMLSGYMIGHLSHILICSVTWLPLLVLLLDDALARSRLRGAALAGLVFGVSILSGPVQTVFYSVVVLLVHSTYRTSVLYRSDRRVTALLSNFAILIVVLAVGLAMAMVQLLPTWEFIGASNRSAARSLTISGFGIDWSYLITLLAPNYFGGLTGPYWGEPDITQQSLYMGIAPLFLAGLALVWRRTAWTLYLGGFALLGLLISMGTHTPVFSFVYHLVPGFSQFRNALHFLFVFHFYVAILAAEGATALVDRSLPAIRIGLYALGFCLVAALFYGWLPVPADNTALRHAGEAVFLAAGLLCALLLVATVARGRLLGLAQPMLAGLTMVDLCLVTGHSVTLGARASAQSLERPTPLASTIMLDAGIPSDYLLYRRPSGEVPALDVERSLFRVYVRPPTRIYRAPEDQTLFVPLGFNRAALTGLSFVDGYSPVVLTRHQELSDFVGSRSIDRYLELSSVRYLVVVGDEVSLRKVERSLPRALIVGQAETPGDRSQVLTRLADPSFDPFSAVTLEGAAPTQGRGHVVTSSIKFVAHAPNRIEMRTESDKAGYLVLNESYYPGWHAFVDGQETRVYRANHEFKAIELPGGSHRVVFSFSPTSFAAGLTVTLTTLAAAMVFLLWRRCLRWPPW